MWLYFKDNADVVIGDISRKCLLHTCYQQICETGLHDTNLYVRSCIELPSGGFFSPNKPVQKLLCKYLTAVVRRDGLMFPGTTLRINMLRASIGDLHVQLHRILCSDSSGKKVHEIRVFVCAADFVTVCQKETPRSVENPVGGGESSGLTQKFSFPDPLAIGSVWQHFFQS